MKDINIFCFGFGQVAKSFFDYNLKFPTYVEGLNYIRNNLV